jgi:ferrochelatase
MKIETLSNLIGGELLNRPYISEVVHFTQNVDEVNRGSCFFAASLSDIPQAIKNGAYAIITKDYVDILDKEIAWIKVDDFKKAIFNIFKYENLKHEIYLVDKISLMLIDAMSLDKRVVVLKDTDDFFKAINLREKFIFTDDEAFENIFANIKYLDASDIELKQLGLFKSVYKNQEINLPFVYKDSFSKVVSFFDKNSLKYTLEFELKRFKPVFVDSLNREVEFGESDRVVITGIENDEVFFDEINFFIENTKHAKSVVVDEKRKDLLKKPFNFAMAVGFRFEPAEIKEKGLFDD